MKDRNMVNSQAMSGAVGVAEVVARTTKPIVFGMPGGHMIQLFDAIRDHGDDIDVRLVREESLATVMAESWGRLTGRPAFVVAQGAWVLGNGSIGVMEALLGSSPMVILIDGTEGGSRSHHGPYQGGLGGWGAYSLPAAMQAITKQVFVACDATQAVQMTQLAIKHALTGQPGPVAVIFHSRSLNEMIDPSTQPTIYLDGDYLPYRANMPGDAELANAGELLGRADRPVIIAGSGCRLSGAEDALMQLARSADIPVVTTPAGKGTFPETDPLSAGVIGPFGQEAANELVRLADTVLAIGTKLSPTDTGNSTLINPESHRIIQVDVEPRNLAWTYPLDAAVIGDARSTLERLIPLVSELQGDGRARVQQARRAGYFTRVGARPEFGGRDVAEVLSDVLPPEIVLACDAGENRLFMLHDFVVQPGGTVLQPNGGGGMGYAVPAATAAAIARPGSFAVAVCGDGGFGMSLQGVLTAHELGVRLLVVVMDNNALGWVLHGQGDRPIASKFAQVDFAAVSAGLGARAASVDSRAALTQAVADSLTYDGVTVVIARTALIDQFQDVMTSIDHDDVETVDAGDGSSK